jgi:predicted nucleotidyltransferase
MVDDDSAIFAPDGWLALNLEPIELDELRRLTAAVVQTGGRVLVAVVGSVAREQRTDTSDVDVIVVAENPAIPPDIAPSSLSVAFRYLDDFLDRLQEGESFAFCALRDARPAHDSGLLDELRQFVSHHRLSATIEDAVQFAMQRIEHLAAVGTAPAGEDLRSAARAVGNVAVLTKGELPLSGPELVDQLRDVGELALADIVRDSRAPEPAQPDRFIEPLNEVLRRLAPQPKH